MYYTAVAGRDCGTLPGHSTPSSSRRSITASSPGRCFGSACSIHCTISTKALEALQQHRVTLVDDGRCASARRARTDSVLGNELRRGHASVCTRRHVAWNRHEIRTQMGSSRTSSHTGCNPETTLHEAHSQAHACGAWAAVPTTKHTPSVFGSICAEEPMSNSSGARYGMELAAGKQ